VGPAVIRAVEVNHWGARLRTDTYRGYNGYVIASGRRRVFFAGDTADTDKLARIAGHNGVDVAIMPIGAYDPWIRFHCTPEQSWRMSRDVRADWFLPVHHRTFLLSREPLNEPIERLYNAAGRHAESIALRDIGAEFRLT
jgi:L-ascorbate metabolism protein UlaG (beta-lactamase superfamily)